MPAPRLTLVTKAEKKVKTKVGKPKPKAFPDYSTAGKSRPNSKMLASSRASGKR